MTDGSIHHTAKAEIAAVGSSEGALGVGGVAGDARPRVWAFASGKGGVGKSLIAANLGAILAESDWPTLVVDLDQSGPNLHTFLGVSREGFGVADVLGGTLPFAHAPLPHEVPGLAYVLGGKGDLATVPSPRGLLSSLWRFKGIKERGVPRPQEVLLDCASGADPFTLDSFLGADVPVLVVNPDPASVENAHRFLDRAWCRALEAGLGGTLSPGRLLQSGMRALGSAYVPRSLLGWLGERGATFATTGEEVDWNKGLRVGDVPTDQNGVPPKKLRMEDIGSIWPVVPHLVVNRVKHPADVDVGFAMIRAVEDYFGIKMPYLGAILEDPGVGLSVQRRRLRVRERGEERLSKGLEMIADHAVEGGGLTPGGDRLFALT